MIYLIHKCFVKIYSTYRVGQKSGTPFNYLNIIAYKVQNTTHLYCLNNFNICYYSQFNCADWFENIFVFLSERQCFFTRRL